MITNHTVESLRDFEESVAADFNAARIRAPVHLSGGNEAELLKIFQDVGPSDWIATNWRSHLHCLLRGVPPERLRADCLAGKSITLNYPDFRIISSAIVGGVLPIALGIAWSIKRAGKDERVFAFAGDMTAAGGMFHECTQYAVGFRLPIRFVVEDNGLSVCTDTGKAWGYATPVHIGRHDYDYKLPWPHAGAGRRVEF